MLIAAIARVRRAYHFLLRRIWRREGIIPHEATDTQWLKDAYAFLRDLPCLAPFHKALWEYTVHYCGSPERFAAVCKRMDRRYCVLNPGQHGVMEVEQPGHRGRNWVAPLKMGKRIRFVTVAIRHSGDERTDMITFFHEAMHPLLYADTFRSEALKRQQKAIKLFEKKTQMVIDGFLLRRDPSMTDAEWVNEIICECDAHELLASFEHG